MADEKKHKSGFALLKEKLAKAEAELAQAESARNNYSAQLDRSRTDVHNLNIEVNELKEKIAKLEKKLEDVKSDHSEELLRNDRCWEYKLKEIEKERDEWKKDAEAKQTTIDQQSRKISQLTADLHNSETLRLNADAAHSKKEGEMLRAMGPIRRWWWNLHHLPTFKEDERWNETH